MQGDLDRGLSLARPSLYGHGPPSRAHRAGERLTTERVVALTILSLWCLHCTARPHASNDDRSSHASKHSLWPALEALRPAAFPTGNIGLVSLSGSPAESHTAPSARSTPARSNIVSSGDHLSDTRGGHPTGGGANSRRIRYYLYYNSLQLRSYWAEKARRTERA